MSATENSEFAVPEVVAENEKEESKEIKATKRPAEVSTIRNFSFHRISFEIFSFFHRWEFSRSQSALSYLSNKKSTQKYSMVRIVRLLFDFPITLDWRSLSLTVAHTLSLNCDFISINNHTLNIDQRIVYFFHLIKNRSKYDSFKCQEEEKKIHFVYFCYFAYIHIERLTLHITWKYIIHDRRKEVKS